jgi:sigma-E factor negative regulatory protein RseA
MHENDRDDAELLSALMDDELSPGERDALFRRLQREPALQARWTRYHAARAALTTGAVRLAPGFSDRVRDERAREPSVLAPERTGVQRPPWLRPLAGVAIAASVALLAIGGLTLLRGPMSPEPPISVADGGGAAVPDHDPAAITPVAVATGQRAADGTTEPVRKRLLLYLASHNEYADTLEVPTVIPYGRLGSLNAGQ